MLDGLIKRKLHNKVGLRCCVSGKMSTVNLVSRATNGCFVHVSCIYMPQHVRQNRFFALVIICRRIDCQCTRDMFCLSRTSILFPGAIPKLVKKVPKSSHKVKNRE